MPDGSIRISTKIDNSKIDKGIIELENKIKKLQQSNSKNSLEQKSLEQEIKKYNDLCFKADEYKNKIKELKLEKERIFKQNPALSVQIDTPEYARIKTQIQEMKEKYTQATIEIDKQAPKIEKIHQKLQDVKNQQEENNTKIKQYNKELEESQRKQLELNYNTEGISKSVNKGISKILRYGAALLSIRSIYGLLSNTMNTWLNGNSLGARQLKSDIDYMKNTVGAALSPILKYIVNLLYEALGLVGALIKTFTGLDIYAGSVADYMDSTNSSANKTNKELKKQLASFDEINKLESQKYNSNGGANILKPSQDLSSVMEKYLGLAEQIKQNFMEIKDYVIAIGLGIAGWKLGDLLGLTGKQKLGLAIGLSSLYFYVDGIAGIARGELTAENFMKAFGASAGLGVSTGLLTGNWKLALIITLGTIAFSGGLTLGDWIKDYVPDSIDWYIKEVNLDWDNDNIVEKIWKTIVVILGTIGDAIRTFARETFGEKLSIGFIEGANDGKEELKRKLFDFLIDNLKQILLLVADIIENIPLIGKGIANGIRSGVRMSEDSMSKTIENTAIDSIENAKTKINEKAMETGGQAGTNWMSEMKSKMANEKENLQSTIEDTVEQASSNSIENVQNNGKDIGSNYMKATKETISNSKDLLSTTIKQTSNEATSLSSSSIEQNGKTLGNKNINGMKLGEASQKNNLSRNTTQVVKEANNSVDTSSSSSIGKNIITGIDSGLNNNKSSLWTSMAKLGSSLLSAFSRALGIHSPSKEMAFLAKFIPLRNCRGDR